MINYTTLLITGLIFLVCRCTTTENETFKPTLATIEVGEDNSYANIYRVSTKHLHLELDVNFENKSIYGVARHEIENNHADTAIFDIKGLQIQKVTTGKKGNEKNTSYLIGIEDSLNGAPLSVLVSPKTRFINIYYQTTDQTKSLHWNQNKSLTVLKNDTTLKDTLIGTTKPPNFLFTLPGEHYIRNWIPLQDIGYRKINYSASVRVPKGLIPLMGAINPTKQNDSSTYYFESTSPVSLYEIGLTIGDFRFKKLSEKSGIYFLSKTSQTIYNEVKPLPALIKNIEKTFGKSPWATTNFVILPDTFSIHTYTYPCTYFIHPSFFSKYQNSTYDIQKFLLSHWPNSFFSTNCTTNFALESGITNYYLNRFVLLNYGKEQSELASKLYINSCLLSQKEDFTSSTLPTNVYTEKCNTTKPYKPKDLAFKQLKGFLLMKSLETNLGTNKLDNFVRKYISKNQTYSLSDFERELNHFLTQEEVIQYPLKNWLYGKKIPPITYKISSKRHIQIHVFVKSLISNKRFFRLRKTKDTFNHFTPFDWLTFISLLPPQTETKKLKQLEKLYHLSMHPNKNIQRAWIRYGIKNNFSDAQTSLQRILARYGDEEYKQSFYCDK